MFWRSALLFCLLLLMGCSSRQEPTSSSSLDGSAPEWSLTAQDSIGTPEDTLVFEGIADLEVAANGRVYVADGLGNSVYVLDAALNAERMLGRAGRGPGEFRFPTSLSVVRDSVFVYDLQQRRITGVSTTPGGDPAVVINTPSVTSLGRFPAIPRTAHASTPGRFFVYYDAPNVPPSMKSDARLASGVGVLRADETYINDQVVTFSKSESFKLQFADGRSLFTSAPFGRRLLVETDSHHLLTGWSDRLVVHRTPPGESPRPFMRDTIPPRPLRDAHIDRFKTRLGTRDVDWDNVAEHSPFPETWPAMFDLTTGADGTVWVQIDIAERDGRSAWWIYDADGQRIAGAEINSDVSLHAIQGATAYGVRTAPSGAQSVVRYHVDTSGGA